MSIIKRLLLRQFRSSIPKAIKNGTLVFIDDLDKMADDILDMTGKRSEIQGIGGVTIEDIKEILVEIRENMS